VSIVDLRTVSDSARAIATLMEGALTLEVRKAVEQLAEESKWELLSHLLLTGAEVSARHIADTLIEREILGPVVAAACMRREARRPSASSPRHEASARRIFRDFEQDDEGAGVPEHIMSEAEAIAAAAEQSRRIAIQREAQLDRDPIRQHIVDELAELLNTSEPAMEALVVIARASAWEDTRRMAAMKVANNKIAMGRIVRASRIDDITTLGAASGSRAVAGKLAGSLAESMPEASDPGYQAALGFVAKHHPDADRRNEAQQKLNSGQ
jgi:hypothetical protein